MFYLGYQIARPKTRLPNFFPLTNADCSGRWFLYSCFFLIEDKVRNNFWVLGFWHRFTDVKVMNKVGLRSFRRWEYQAETVRPSDRLSRRRCFGASFLVFLPQTTPLQNTTRHKNAIDAKSCITIQELTSN